MKRGRKSNLALTDRALQVYGFIIDYKRRYNGNSPSFQEIMAECKITSQSIVLYNLEKLEEHGLIIVNPRIARSIEVMRSEWVPPPPIDEILKDREMAGYELGDKAE